MKTLIILLTLTLLGAATTAMAQAIHEVELKDGSLLTGQILEQADGFVKLIDNDDQVVYVNLDQVKAITSSAAAVPAGAVASATTSVAAASTATTMTAVDLKPSIRDKQTSYNIKLGLFSSGTIYVGDREIDGSSGFSWGTGIETKLGPGMLGGLYFDYDSIDDLSLIDLGVSLRGQVGNPNQNVLFRPGISFGYGRESNTEASFLMLKGGLEVVFNANKKQSALAEIAVVGGLAGGNEDVDASFGPGFLARAGMVF